MEATASKRKAKNGSSESSAKPTKKLKTLKSADHSLVPTWNDYDLLAEMQDMSIQAAKATINLLEEGNTIPFIARYRRHMTGDLSPEKLRDVKGSYESICALKSNIAKVIKNLQKIEVLDDKLMKQICSAKSMEILDHIYAPYKPKRPHTLADKAKKLGLEQPALDILNHQEIDLHSFVNKQTDGLKDVNEVSLGIQHIIAQIIASDIDIITFLKDLVMQKLVLIKTSRRTARKTDKNIKENNVDETKFSDYFDYETTVKHIKPHQILAINRGENLKVLSVKFMIPPVVSAKLNEFCWNHLQRKSNRHNQLIGNSILDAYNRLLQPLLIREIRRDLNMKAEKASYSVFSANVKQLFMASPVKGKRILAIDPGFKVGCKIAVVSETGALLDYAVIYPHSKFNSGQNDSAEKLKSLLLKHSCSLIALGDGTACRETEAWLSELIQKKAFSPLDVKYTIIRECGASIYSCSPEAKKEFPILDVNIISAVSLARRLQDPMSELVKIEPCHLGVGMYQHDLNKKALNEVLDETVVECVSFIGVDINTTSQCLLRRIAGLGDVRAKKIIEYRESHGPFLNRSQLQKITGIGEKIFNQCAGFIRIAPSSSDEAESFYSNAKTNPLDCTWIHPESYDIATKIAKEFNLPIKNIGKPEFIELAKLAKLKHTPESLATKYKCYESTLKLIFDVFERPLDHDLRSELPIQPLFKSGIKKFEELKCGDVLTGQVNNCTHFGCFVDVGVGTNGLIHSSKMKSYVLGIGDRVEVKVENVDVPRKRLQLSIISVLL